MSFLFASKIKTIKEVWKKPRELPILKFKGASVTVKLKNYPFLDYLRVILKIYRRKKCLKNKWRRCKIWILKNNFKFQKRIKMDLFKINYLLIPLFFPSWRYSIFGNSTNCTRSAGSWINLHTVGIWISK